MKDTVHSNVTNYSQIQKSSRVPSNKNYPYSYSSMSNKRKDIYNHQIIIQIHHQRPQRTLDPNVNVNNKYNTPNKKYTRHMRKPSNQFKINNNIDSPFSSKSNPSKPSKVFYKAYILALYTNWFQTKFISNYRMVAAMNGILKN